MVAIQTFSFFFVFCALSLTAGGLPTNAEERRRNAFFKDCVSGWITRINDYCIYPGQAESCFKFPKVDDQTTHSYVKKLAVQCCRGRCEITALEGACCRTADCLPRCYKDFKLPRPQKASLNRRAKGMYTSKLINIGEKYMDEDEDE